MHCKGYFEQTIGASLVLEVIPFDEILLMQRQVENSAKLVGSGGVSIYINIYRYYIHFHIYIYIYVLGTPRASFTRLLGWVVGSRQTF